MPIDPQVAALLTAGGGALGSLVMWLGQRRSGKLTMTDHQLRYINDQQQDIADLKADNQRLRADFLDLWEWARDATHEAARNNVTLPPLPRQRPRSQTSTAEERKEHSG
jgi:hypothetical protein